MGLTPLVAMKYVTRLSSSRTDAYHTDKDCYRLKQANNIFEIPDNHELVKQNPICPNCDGGEIHPGTLDISLRHRIQKLESELGREVTEEDLRENA